MSNKLVNLVKENPVIRNQKFKNGEVEFADLKSLRANCLELENYQLPSANLTDINWRSCSLVNVNLENANLSNGKIRLCKFINVIARNASFRAAVLENSWATGCDFEEAIFTDASITDSDFNRSNFKGADLTNTDASYCNMRGVDFRGAKLIKTKFRDADLRGADFTGAYMEDVDFYGANIEGALFDESFHRVSSQAETNTMQGIVDPVARNIVKSGSERELFNEAQAMAELESIMESVFSSNKTTDDKLDLNEQINKIMASAASVGVDSLLDSLQQKEGEPPAAIKKMIEELMKDSDLPDGATTEDLLSSLLDMMNKK